jgi:hypothetical protein
MAQTERVVSVKGKTTPMKCLLLLFTLALLPLTIASQNHNPLAFDTGNDIYSARTSKLDDYLSR